MELRDYVANETSALVTRLLAAQSDTSLQHLQTLRDALDTTTRAQEAATPQISGDVEELVKRLTHAAGAAVRTASQRIRDEAQTALDAARLELEAERSQHAKLMVTLQNVEAESDVLRAERQSESDRADAVLRDLAVMLDAHRQLEASHAELQAACTAEAQARAAVGEELREARALLDSVFADASRLGELLQAERAEHETLKGELAEARAASAQIEAVRAMAEASAALEIQARAAAESELLEVRASLDVALSEDARLGVQLEASAAEKGKLLAALSAAQGELQTAQEQREAIAAQLTASTARVHTLERTQAKQEESLRRLQDRAGATQDTETGTRPEAVDRLASLFEASVRAVDELASATTIAELLGALVTQLSAQFARVAVFRVKSNRLEGEHQVGFNQTTDISKLVIPLSMNSPLTRVVSSGAVETLTASEVVDSGGLPFGGTSAPGIAVPIVLQGETLAVVYADDAGDAASVGAAAIDESKGRFAQLLCRQSVVLMMRLTHELKTLAELRDYAALLLNGAEQMHTADADAGTPGDKLRSRLKDSLDCARQLFAQRASLEGVAAAGLFDEHIADLLQAQTATQFTRDLAALVGHTTDADSRRAAEAS